MGKWQFDQNLPAARLPWKIIVPRKSLSSKQITSFQQVGTLPAFNEG
ncbi:MAG: hypothetical protein KGJ60_03060 [Verrucomicrobiota bacterium]|nr:hypothetical protein [Verrucomicrobiota bacterium]